MKLYFAPLEGITTYTYRNAHFEMFGGCDAYFAPFITPTDNERISMKNLRDIIPENNKTPLKVQVLINSATALDDFIRKIKEFGYTSVNINFGCPSGTVVKKGRGSGALKDIEKLDKMLGDVFSNVDFEISVKTRTGFYSQNEFEEILKVYNKYPISELIIHPRVREDFYNNVPHMETFKSAYANAKMPLCYNGDIFTVSDYEKTVQQFKNIGGVMIGRGAIKNPAIFREIRGGKALTTSELADFSKLLEERYLKVLQSEAYTLQKLKEIWMYIMWNFPEEKKILKAIKKSSTLMEINMAIRSLPKL